MPGDLPKNLRARWKTPAGRRAVAAIEHGLRGGESQEQLKTYVRDLPGITDVAPALDLRGIDLPELVAVRRTDLTDVRFDHAKLNWTFAGSNLQRAVFDGAEGHNIHFGGSPLASSSFVNARLPGAIFILADLHEARLDGIQMRSGQLKDADCRATSFVGADLRLVWAAGADLRGADLTDANLVGASLGGAQWDESTRFTGAKLSPEGTPADMLAHAIANGASAESERSAWQLQLIDATREALKSRAGSRELDSVVDRLTELRQDVEKNPASAWANILRHELPPRLWEIVQDAVREAATNMGSYLDRR